MIKGNHMIKITHKLATELLHYDPTSGILKWRSRDRKWFKTNRSYNSWNSRYAGIIAGTNNNKKLTTYLDVSIFKKRVKAHRLIWLITSGHFPDVIDHINGNGLDNRLSNLRNVTTAENNRNMRMMKTNTSGVTGVCFDVRESRWCAQICIKGINTNLGGSTSFFEAICLRKSAELKNDYHPNHGKKRQC